jgi:predicted aldo/keto reductase-like oxidoreductase
MEEITIPCPTEGCDGAVTTTAEPIMSGTEWSIQYVGDDPAVRCSKGCKSPVELEEPVKGALQAG